MAKSPTLTTIKRGSSNDNTPRRRSTRSNFGKRTHNSNEFLDSGKIVVDSSDELDRDDESSQEEGPISKRVKLSKAKGTLHGEVEPQPLSELLEPLDRSDEPEATEVDTVVDNEDAAMLRTARSTVEVQPLQLLFKVPENHQGSFIVNIDFSSLVTHGHVNITTPQLPVHDPKAVRANKSAPTTTTSITATVLRVLDTKATKAIRCTRATYENLFEPARPATIKVGFNHLPAELRSKVYKLVFKGQDNIAFTDCNTDYERSSAFLRTCKRVHKEGCSVLYGENVFLFRRELKQRGRFYDKLWGGVGYEDIRRFVDMIGQINISLIRKVGIALEDAPGGGIYARVVESRRFVNDIDLRYFLQQLGKYGRLDSIMIEAHGRRRLDVGDFEFLHVLKHIQTDKLAFGYLPDVNYSDYDKGPWDSGRDQDYRLGRNIGLAVRSELQLCMVRRNLNRSPKDKKPGKGKKVKH